ncbi:eCIS core domain-containing protein [Mucilaginibacter phyllosphaerae]|uniref:DUF4157 domain-containing protein n=1 Tax=Mucilaginibacter phyllosphaerae TaxID=1812349 RepID=A0A4Y8ABV0_9SPHI|nr:DUF4157 domain-containing protein [Mucilaginibacter phyllosphaerae]MBB3969156.1 hypothetical protein [Mucilaginibacter phyllosphaerae]TEW66034.1 DUF4157 domain-containing protein [Mucilaginibacter phyllosphaerae]GGH06655.1 hypothetical protein GCM10007352_10990 [Mucilaginibacter phyllosphaerae]
MFSYDNREQAHAPSSNIADVVQKRSNQAATIQLVDNRKDTVVQKQSQTAAQHSPQTRQAVQLQAMANRYTAHKPMQPIQRQTKGTGLPAQLKAGVENLSGLSMDDVKVHYNSAQPAQMQAHAYAQGTDIHIAPGQEEHLPHEAWHVVQQKQGRVKPTIQLKGEIAVNDDNGLEKESDVMGARANSFAGSSSL